MSPARRKGSAAAAAEEAWGRLDEPERAIARILDAAERAIAREGVSAVGMAEVAREAGCSRATLYRYFPSRHALHLAYVDRAAAEVVSRVRERAAGLEDPLERTVEAIMVSVAEVRASPGMASWFAAGDAGSAARMSRASEVVARLTEGFVAGLFDGGPRGQGASDPANRLRARFMVRMILSLLSQPGDDAAEERALVERFVAPAVLAG